MNRMETILYHPYPDLWSLEIFPTPRPTPKRVSGKKAWKARGKVRSRR